MTAVNHIEIDVTLVGNFFENGWKKNFEASERGQDLCWRAGEVGDGELFERKHAVAGLSNTFRMGTSD